MRRNLNSDASRKKDILQRKNNILSDINKIYEKFYPPPFSRGLNSRANNCRRVSFDAPAHESRAAGIVRKIARRMVVAATIALFAATDAKAQNFVVDNLIYQVTDAANHEVKITGASIKYGSVSLPSGVVYNDTKYTVTSIGDNAFNDGYYQLVINAQMPSQLQAIGAKAFSGCRRMKGDLVLPQTLKKIGMYAFYNCDSVSGVLTIPANVEEIGERAFANCKSLTGITYRARNVSDYSGTNLIFTSVGDYTSGIPLVIGKEVERVPNNMFASTTANVRSLKFEPGSVCTEIGKGAFYHSRSRSVKYPGFYPQGRLEIPASVKKIERNAFACNTQFTSVVIPASVDSIKEDAFRELEGVDSLCFLADCAFESQTNRYTEVLAAFTDMGEATDGLHVFFGKKVKRIWENQFSQTNLRSVTFEEGSALEEIGSSALAVATLQGDIILPNTVRTIGYQAFYETAISSVNIPEGTETIGEGAFSLCNNLEKVEYFAKDAKLVSDQYYGAGAFVGSGLSVNGYALSVGRNVKIIPPCLFENGGAAESKREEGGGANAIDFAAQGILDSIGASAFNGNTLLTGTISIPATVRSVGESAFYGCSGISKAIIPSNVERVGNHVFYNCNALEYASYDVANGTGVNLFPVAKSFNETGEEGEISNYVLVIGKNVATIPDGFCYGGAVDSISLRNAGKLREIGKSAFAYCGEMRGHDELLFPEGLESIGEYAFSGCSKLDGALRIPSTIKTLGREAFDGFVADSLIYNAPGITKYMLFFNTSLEFAGGLVVGAAIEEIEKEMFADCDISTLSFEQGSMLTRIGANAFSKRVKGGALGLPESLKVIGSGAFADCGFTGKLVLPAMLDTIGSSAFVNCAGLVCDNFVFPKNLTEIPAYAFSGCKGFTGTLRIPSRIESLGFDAFAGTGFTHLVIEDSDMPLITGNDFNKTGGWIIKSRPMTRATAMKGYLNPRGMFADMPLETAYVGRNLKYLCGAMADMAVARQYYSPFNQARSIKKIVLGNRVSLIRHYQFSNCTALETIAIPEGVDTICQGAFIEDIALVVVRIPRSVGYIGGSAFAGCVSLAEVYVGNEQNVANAVKLTRAVAEDATTIDSYAFASCGNLHSVVLYDNVNQIGDYAFGYCSALTDFYCLSTVPQAVSAKAFYNVDTKACSLHVPSGSKPAYDSADVWKDFMVDEKKLTAIGKVKIDDEATEIARYTLDGQRIFAPQQGVNIVKMSNGTVKKVLVK